MTLSLINQLGPIFLLVGAGYCLAWRGLLDNAAIGGITRMTFWVLIPATLFQTISATRVAELFNINIWIAYYGAVAITATGSYIAFTKWQKNTHAEGVVLAFASIFSNIGMLGLPLIDILFGHDGMLTLATILCVHALSLLTLTVLLLEWSRNREGGDPLRVLARTLKAQLCNPIIAAILIAVIVASLNIHPPVMVDTFLSLLRRAMPPVALILIGAGIYGQTLHGNLATSLTGAIAKTCVMPLLAFAIGMFLGLPAKVLAPIVMTAALPPGINPVLMATAYQTARERTSTILLIATLISIVVIPVLAICFAL
jgi:predicted permease